MLAHVNIERDIMEPKHSHCMDEVLLFCHENNLPARVVGQWVWIKYPAKPKQSMLEKLEEFGFHWSKRRKQWFNPCGLSSEPAIGYEPWDRYKTTSLRDALSK
jgi:hypothetical protein